MNNTTTKLTNINKYKSKKYTTTRRLKDKTLANIYTDGDRLTKMPSYHHRL